MSITSAMLAGAAGMRANSSTLSAISDNIANVNTVGYKRIRTDFTAALSSQNQLTTHSAGGVLSNHSHMMFEQGSPVASSVSTHLAIQGPGFFIVRSRSDDAGPADPYLYSRAGQFKPDEDGYLRSVSGHYLHGWRVADDGTVTANPTDLAALEPVQVAGIAGNAEASTRLSISANLQSSQAISPAAAGYDVDANNMASGAVTADFELPLQVYDSQGGLHTVTIGFLKTAANTWATEVYLPDSEVIAGGGLANGQLGRGNLVFTAFGQLDTGASTLPTSVTINANGVAGAPQWEADQGVATQTIQLQFGPINGQGGLTSFDAPSVLGTSNVNGTPFGALASVDVDDEGFVTAIFTNGLTRQIYQIPLATFPNYDALAPTDGGVFRLAPGTGQLAMRAAGAAGTGEITSRALEGSTVDLAEEFSNLILTQRAYSASSKIITTADEMLDELIRLKR